MFAGGVGENSDVFVLFFCSFFFLPARKIKRVKVGRRGGLDYSRILYGTRIVLKSTFVSISGTETL